MPNLDEEVVFNAARRIEAPEARRLYVEQACGANRGLRARIEALLRVHDQEQSFLEPPTQWFPAGAEDAIREGPGTVIGPYKLLEQIGEGGFGVVFLAEQQQPLCRRVALKVLKPGMDTRRVVARFEAERQALALMDHPNIAKVLDGGTTASGRPYFVMELVKGVPITTFCDQHRLPVRERLGLFVGVCQAVQHAHQKGIIHRDLKPSNVLVTLHDGAPAAKVIDFGIAKALGQRLTDKTLLTHAAQLLGTPLYMSPEQAELGGLDVDTRTDVYTLGVLLYELLTGTTPFDKERLGAAAFDEVRRIIREEEPAKPSTRVHTLGDAALTVTADRQSDPARLSRLCRGELDWIVMKCLEKDRARRYGTADGLARDVRRYLNEEPVEAGPPTAGYRLRKLARAHRKLLGVAGAFALLLVLGSAVSIGQAVRATRAEQDTARERDKVLAEKARADEQAAIAKAVNDFVQKSLLAQADLAKQPADKERQRDITVRQLLDRAAREVGETFRGQETTEAAIRLTLARAYRALGEYPEAQVHLERSLELRRQKLGDAHPETLDSMDEFVQLSKARGRWEDVERLAKQILEARTAGQGPDHFDTLQAMNCLASVYLDRSRPTDAEPLFKHVLERWRVSLGPDHTDTVTCLNNLAVTYLLRGRFADAEPLLKEVVQRRARLGADHPLTLRCTNNLAGCYMELKRYEEAEPLYKQLLEVRRAKHGPEHPDTLFSLNAYALVLDTRGRHAEAGPMLEWVLEVRRVKLGPDHPETLTSLSNLGLFFSARGRDDRAETLLRQAFEGRRARLTGQHADTLRSANNLAVFYRDRGRLDEAEPLSLEAVAGAKKRLGLGHPQTRLYVNNLADLRGKQGKPELAEAELREVADFLRENAGPDSAAYAGQRARLAQNLLAQKKYAEAEVGARDSLAVQASKAPDAWSTFETQSLLGGALLGQEKRADAEPLLRRGYEGMKAREAQIPKDARSRLAEALERLVRLYETWGKDAEAARWRTELENEKARPKP